MFDAVHGGMMEHVDVLTELPNRAALDGKIKSMIEHGESVALAVLDVDYFLEINVTTASATTLATGCCKRWRHCCRATHLTLHTVFPAMNSRLYFPTQRWSRRFCAWKRCGRVCRKP